MKDNQKSKENKELDVTTQSGICRSKRSCCSVVNCNATYVALSGGNYVFDHCGCDNVYV